MRSERRFAPWSTRSKRRCALGTIASGTTWRRWRRTRARSKSMASVAKALGGAHAGTVLQHDAGHAGMTLEDFCAAPEATRAELSEAEVLALRLLTGRLGLVLGSFWDCVGVIWGSRWDRYGVMNFHNHHSRK